MLLPFLCVLGRGLYKARDSEAALANLNSLGLQIVYEVLNFKESNDLNLSSLS
ncbi:hypothetical protein BH11BAC3_BH11BAC3_31830 [soil metagenome]